MACGNPSSSPKLDVKKAFDIVLHGTLLQALERRAFHSGCNSRKCLDADAGHWSLDSMPLEAYSNASRLPLISSCMWLTSS
eukprot:742339-Amphidinium_carterae.1